MLTKVNSLTLVQAAGVHVWFVAHPRQLREWRGQAPNLYDISGSAHFINKASCCWELVLGAAAHPPWLGDRLAPPCMLALCVPPARRLRTTTRHGVPPCPCTAPHGLTRRRLVRRPAPHSPTHRRPTTASWCTATATLAPPTWATTTRPMRAARPRRQRSGGRCAESAHLKTPQPHGAASAHGHSRHGGRVVAALFGGA